MDKRLTIFTPTYNRDYILPRLYQSLCEQTCSSFVWLIVDDGSTDTTFLLVQKWQSEGLIDIRYYLQPNGGKMRAHNQGVMLCKTPLFMCIDSDDYFCSPIVLDDVLDFLDKNHDIIEQQHVCGILTYRKMVPETKGVFVNDLQLCTLTDIYARGYCGETAPVFKTDVLLNYPFPEIEGEKFITEDIVYDLLSLKYQFVLFPYYTQVCEYLQNGYTRNGWDVLYKNPKGYRMYYNQLVVNGRKNPIYHMKMYIACSLLVGDGKTFSMSGRKLLMLLVYPLGLYQYFKLKRRKW